MYHPPFRYILITKTQCRGLKHVSLLQTCTVPIFSFYTPTTCKNATVHDTDSHVQLASIFSQFNAGFAFSIIHNKDVQNRLKSHQIPSQVTFIYQFRMVIYLFLKRYFGMHCNTVLEIYHSKISSPARYLKII